MEAAQTTASPRKTASQLPLLLAPVFVSRVLTAPCSPCPPAACSCVQKSGVCEQCIGRRRSLQGVPVMQCNCCTGMMCANNSTNTGSVCAGPPSDPDFGEVTATPTGGNLYTLDIALIASNDTGAVGVGEFMGFCSAKPVMTRSVKLWRARTADLQRLRNSACGLLSPNKLKVLPTSMLHVTLLYHHASGMMEYAITANYAAGGYAFGTGGAPTSPVSTP